jgi:hypothetical protein
MNRVTRRILALILELALLASTAGCFFVDMQAPYGPDVKILPRDVPVEVTRRYQKWFAIWGTFHLAGKDPSEVIAEEKLVEARVYTEDSVEDVISSFIYFFCFPAGIILPQTIVVEGNRAPLTEEGLPMERHR